ncbi:MAG: response regulator [Elusimicrobia bacterium]|nr:response regulator [Elusimicrobiota bacterium]
MSQELNILVVEDSEPMRNYLLSLLEGQGYHVNVAENGEKALTLLQSFHPDLILSDFTMPNLDGFGMLRLLQGEPELRDVPIIVLTGMPINEGTRKMVEWERNVKRIFSKPPQVEQLLEAIREVAEAKVEKGPAPLLGGDYNPEPPLRYVRLETDLKTQDPGSPLDSSFFPRTTKEIPSVTEASIRFPQPIPTEPEPQSMALPESSRAAPQPAAIPFEVQPVQVPEFHKSTVQPLPKMEKASSLEVSLLPGEKRSGAVLFAFESKSANIVVVECRVICWLQQKEVHRAPAFILTPPLFLGPSRGPVEWRGDIFLPLEAAESASQAGTNLVRMEYQFTAWDESGTAWRISQEIRVQVRGAGDTPVEVRYRID